MNITDYYKLLNIDNPNDIDLLLNRCNQKLSSFKHLPFLNSNQQNEVKELKKAKYIINNKELKIIYDNILLPELKIGDWIKWPNMGAYTMAATTSFNGIPFHKRHVFLLE